MNLTNTETAYMQELADRIYSFIDRFAQVSKNFNGTNEKYTNPDVRSLLACADLLKNGKKPKICFSSWKCSGAYEPQFSKEGKEEHDFLISEIEDLRNVITLNEIQSNALKVKEILGLNSSPVGVSFIFSEAEIPLGVEKLTGHRYCQALMKARHGAHVLLDAEGIACPAAAAAFGFKQLPEGLKTGKGLVGFGIVNDEATGKAMFEGMTTLLQGKLAALYLFPLEKATIEPDIVVVEDETEKLMWFALANLNVKGGQRVESSTAILQATCVDATTIPYLQQKFNMSMGCYGCRDATDICPNETVLGFPFKDFEAIVRSLEFLNQKAIPNSRGKNALAMLKRKEAEKISQHDAFNN
jgi:uncharacterized protein (DUF169 family)